MVNGLGVLGWGVGGIEAEAAMLGQPVSMLIPRVVGFKLTGEIPAGVTATDVVLTITEMARKHGVVGKFVEFYGEGVAEVPLANRATIGNMTPGVRLHDRGHLPARRGDHPVPAAHRSRRGLGRAGRGLRQGAGPLARPVPGGHLLRVPGARPLHRGAVDRRAEATAGPHRADRRQGEVPRRAHRLRRRPGHRRRDAAASLGQRRPWRTTIGDAQPAGQATETGPRPVRRPAPQSRCR